MLKIADYGFKCDYSVISNFIMSNLFVRIVFWMSCEIFAHDTQSIKLCYSLSTHIEVDGAGVVDTRCIQFRTWIIEEGEHQVFGTITGVAIGGGDAVSC